MTLPALLQRDPEQSTRTRQFMQQLEGILNPLIRDGTLFQSGVQNWGLVGLLYTGTGAPAAATGYTGDYYLDLSSGVLYRKDS